MVSIHSEKSQLYRWDFFIFDNLNMQMKKANRKLFCVLICFLILNSIQGQIMDSLMNVLKTEKDDTAKVKTLIDIGWEHSYSDLKQTEKFANEALSLSQKLNYQEGIASSFNLVGIIYRSTSQYEKAIEAFKKALQIRIELNQVEMQAKVNINLANVYLDMTDYARAEGYYLIGIEKAKKANSLKAQITALTNLSVVYQNLSDYGKSLDCLFESLKLNKLLKDSEQDGFIYVNIAIIYQEQGQYKLSEEYNFKGLEIFTKLKRDDILANIHNNLGITYKGLGKYDLALKHYNEALQLYKKVGMDATSSMILHNIGGVYYEMKMYDKALQCQNAALAEALAQNDIYYAARCYMSIAEINNALGKFDLAKKYALKGMEMSRLSGDKDELRNCYITLSDIYSASGDFINAYLYQKQVQNISDSINNDAINKRIGQMQAMYEADKKQNEIDLLTKDNVIQSERITRQKIINYTVLGGLFLVLFLAFMSYRRYREKKKAHKEISDQKEIIEEKNKEILDSIHYAKRIQRALLASDNLLKKSLPEFFVLYKPKDIVSGDFYWATEAESKFLLATCDCTGHGVPGAFMSLLNISKLNETVIERKISQPDQILNQVRNEIIKALNPDGNETNAKDGMDAVLCAFDLQNMQLQFAAANNPLILIRNNQLIEYRPDKFPVGMHQGEQKFFTLQTIKLQKGDCIYTFTDGFADQFGGDKGKKLMSKNFKDILLKESSFPFEKQKADLNILFENWRGNIEQIDDVLVIGVRI
jgi:tetratricopeptide (TPR) repeat protein